MEQLALSITAGTLGGHLAGEKWRSLSLGWIVNTLAGLVGGIISGKLLPLDDTGFALHQMPLIVAAGVLGGGCMTFGVGLCRNLLSR
ncbi:hypothetical protein ATO10_07467 [Actibacterium atlanticum]|uniref:Uncharacterized protein n=1 Tax=Actibacterium atlanticum TaxID=1461693 RepID=A0A058ZLZ6_9RHOB|nr:hypothetical protein [Actibacterium atlanticum]KCV82210.1 hypothetical protein ATO10_07467 [Actibacterium atlanticum]